MLCFTKSQIAPLTTKLKIVEREQKSHNFVLNTVMPLTYWPRLFDTCHYIKTNCTSKTNLRHSKNMHSVWEHYSYYLSSNLLIQFLILKATYSFLIRIFINGNIYRQISEMINLLFESEENLL